MSFHSLVFLWKLLNTTNFPHHHWVVSDLGEIAETHTSCNLSGAGERQGLVLVCSVTLGQPDQGFHSTDGSRSFQAAFGCSEKFIPSPHSELEGWPGPKDTSANLLPSSSGGQPGVWSLGLSRAAVSDRQQGAEDLLWLLEKQQQQQQALPESSPASTADADAPLPRDPHRRVKQQVIDGFPN